jgi:hypothetical protein
MRVSIAATTTDWINLFNDVGLSDAYFFPAKGFYSSPIEPYALQTIPNAGKSATGVTILDESYIVSKNIEVNIDQFLLNNGNVKFFVSHGHNDSFVFNHGGQYGEKYFILGEISTVHKTGIFFDFISKIRSFSRRKFHKGNGFFIGPDCYGRYNENFIFTVDSRNYPILIPGVNGKFY